MNTPLFNIGDKVKRTDYNDPKTYTVDKIRKWNKSYIYSMKKQGWADGWAWVSEWNIKRVQYNR